MGRANINESGLGWWVVSPGPYILCTAAVPTDVAAGDVTFTVSYAMQRARGPQSLEISIFPQVVGTASTGTRQVRTAVINVLDTVQQWTTSFTPIEAFGRGDAATVAAMVYIPQTPTPTNTTVGLLGVTMTYTATR